MEFDSAQVHTNRMGRNFFSRDSLETQNSGCETKDQLGGVDFVLCWDICNKKKKFISFTLWICLAYVCGDK